MGSPVLLTRHIPRSDTTHGLWQQLTLAVAVAMVSIIGVVDPLAIEICGISSWHVHLVYKYRFDYRDTFGRAKQGAAAP